jgi:hypothetical protein
MPVCSSPDEESAFLHLSLGLCLFGPCLFITASRVSCVSLVLLRSGYFLEYPDSPNLPA